MLILWMTFMILVSYDQFSKEENGAYLPKIVDFFSGYTIKNYLDEEIFQKGDASMELLKSINITAENEIIE